MGKTLFNLTFTTHGENTSTSNTGARDHGVAEEADTSPIVAEQPAKTETTHGAQGQRGNEQPSLSYVLETVKMAPGPEVEEASICELYNSIMIVKSQGSVDPSQLEWLVVEPQKARPGVLGHRVAILIPPPPTIGTR